MCAAWSVFIAALQTFDIRCFQRIFSSPSKPVSKITTNPVSKATTKPVSQETQFDVQMLDMTRDPKYATVPNPTKLTNPKRSRKDDNKTRTTSKSKPTPPRKAETARAPQAKKRKLQNTQNSTAKKLCKNGGGNSVTIIKLQTKEAREPSGLQTPLSTSSWDPYPDKMPEDLAEAVSERLEAWLSRTDGAADHVNRSAQYGEDVATRFPAGETPGSARGRKDDESNGQEGI